MEDFLSREIPARTFEEVEIPLKVVATNFWDRSQVVFESGSLINAIRASMALPAVFEPVRLNDMVLIDGGAVNPLPYDLIQSQCDLTIAIDVSGEKTYTPGTRSPIWWKASYPPSRSCKPPLWRPRSNWFPPDIYVKPALTNIRVLDFYRYKEILAGVQEEVQRFKETLENLL